MQTVQEQLLDSSTVNHDKFIVRLLNGKLKGCEYHIGLGKTLFVAACDDGADAGNDLLSFPDNSIFIPVQGAGVNFEMIHQPTEHSGVLLRQLGESSVHEQILTSNLAVSIGPVALAVKRADEAWSDDILSYQPGLATAPVIRHGINWRRWSLTTLIGVGIITLAAVVYLGQRDTQQREVVSLSSHLGSDPGQYRILHGRDGIMYVLSANERDVTWARQSLVRANLPQPARVLSLNEESERIRRWLANRHPALMLHQLTFDPSSSPILRLSRQRAALNETERATLHTQLMELIPYAPTIHIAEIDDELVAGEAEAGMKKLALTYTRVDNPGNVTFVISGALNDGELQRIRLFIEEYQQRWNGQYVQFAVEMMDDFLKGKSYMFGPQGYVKMTTGHWYFP